MGRADGDSDTEQLPGPASAPVPGSRIFRPIAPLLASGGCYIAPTSADACEDARSWRCVVSARAFEFDLVAEGKHLLFVERGWERARYLLLELQPAMHVRLVGDPPSRIRVLSHGDQPEVAPRLLARLEELAGTALRVEMR